MEYINDELWFGGCDSISNPGRLAQGTYQWAQNITNRGGMIATRQGVAEIASKLDEKPRGLIVFQPKSDGANPYLVVAIGTVVYALPFNLDGSITAKLDAAHIVAGISFPSAGPRGVQFEICVQAQETDINGVVKVLPTPRFVLMMQDGRAQPAYLYYDGNVRHSGHVVPNSQHPVTPIGDYMKWAGDRLWVAKDNKLHASDLLNPLQNEEEKNTASGGWFYLPSHVTGMGLTHDYKSLMVFTDQTTSVFQVGIEDRALWNGTQDFQVLKFPTIGCTSHRTIINQYGLTWWMSHDGLMSLDNAGQANLTSRITVKDNQMARSREGVSWGSKGGCSGTFGNWLFFSMPSGSSYNVHTWMMDEAPVETQKTEGVWCSNWTGVRPEQWVTYDVYGVQRCFCLSNDPVPQGHGRQATLWEAFIGQRMDIPKNDAGFREPKDIACAWESRFLGLGPNQFAQFRYVELDLAEIIGNVHIQAFYCGRKTSYKKILDRKLQATVSPATDEVFDPESLVNVWVPQNRMVRSESDSHDESDEDSEVQTPYLRFIDKEFSVLVTWTGQLSITAMRVCVDARPDYVEGSVDQDETTIRRITAEGVGEITNVPAPPNTFNQAFTSKYLAPLRPRWVEFPQYDSAVANGVFFVDVPMLYLPPAAYPANYYPTSINISEETAGAQIRWTINGPMPSATTGTVYDPAHRPVIHLNDTLRVKAFKTGLLPSVSVTAPYTKAIAGTPWFSPPPGAYPLEDFAIDRCTFAAGATGDITVLKAHGLVAGDAITFTTTSALPAEIHPWPYVYFVLAAGLTTTKLRIAATVNGALIKFATAGSGWHYIYSTSNRDLNTKTISIATVTPGAKIKYTTDGTIPSRGHGQEIPATSGSIELPTDKTLKAMAYDPANNYLDSAVFSGAYSIKPKCAKPTFLPDGGEHPIEQYPMWVQLKSATTASGTYIRFTINEADMTKNFHNTTADGTGYAYIHANDTLRAFTYNYAHQYIDSDLAVAVYDVTPVPVSTPRITPHEGDWNQPNLEITFHCDTPGASMKYTNEKSTADPNIPSHTNGIAVTDGTKVTINLGHRTIRVIAFKGGLLDSPVVEKTYDRAGEG